MLELGKTGRKLINMDQGLSRIFGPVPSRRLGLSLGVDLIPHKTCSFDCVYCQIGRTTDKRIDPESFYSSEKIISEAKKYIPCSKAQTITLAGSGEPTLSKDLEEILRAIKEISHIPVALLTNGSLFWKPEIREASLIADIILPTFSAAREETFRRLHRPHPQLTLKKVIEGLQRLRDEYHGQIFLELMLVKGVNDDDQEIEALGRKIQELAPDKVQINTVVRPPSEPGTGPVSPHRLEEVKNFLGPRAEVVVATQEDRVASKPSREVILLEMIRRRPLSAQDIQKVTGESLDHVNSLLTDLIAKGLIEEQIHNGASYYKVK